MKGISDIKINSEWFYHQVTPDVFEKIVLSKGIVSSSRWMNIIEMIKNFNHVGWNGYSYISVSKLDRKYLVHKSSYSNFILGQYALVLQDIKALKTHYCCNKFIKKTSVIPLPIRFSNWEDEYQVKGFIPIEKAIGIKIPNDDNLDAFGDINYYINQLQIIDSYLRIMKDTGVYFPFIDIENKKKISHEDIKKYILER